MLDRRFVLENAELVQRNCADRGVKADLAKFVEHEQKRLAWQKDVEGIKQQINEVSKSIGKAKDDAEKESIKERGRQLRERRDNLEADLSNFAVEADRILRGLPNMTHPKSPRGDEADSHELRKGETKPPKFNFKPLDHLALAEQHDLIDFEGGSRVSGNGFYFLRNEAVLLEFALQMYALELLMREGFTPTMTPDLARNEIVQGIGFIPRGPETQIYSVENSDLNLVATAEITLGGLYAGQVLDESQLPIKLAGVSHCFRTEAGAAGRAGRGLYRVHQFTKVEMFAFTTPEQSEDMHNLFLELECEIFDGLGIPFRVLDIASGDLGGPAYRKFDLEAWMPGRGQGGEYGEVTSTSNCTDYQSRRLDIRYKKSGEKGTHFVHTLNGTAVACGRAMIAILENSQQADGSILVPEVLRKYVGKDRIGASDDE